MIVTDHQYKVTQDRISRFSDALEKIRGDNSRGLHELHAYVIQEQIQKLEEAIADYDRLVSGDIEGISVDRLADLPRALVEGRIVAGLSQSQLARASGRSASQIEQWERDGYSRVPLRTMLRIAGLLPLTLQGEAAVEGKPFSERSTKRSLRQAGLPAEIFDRVIAPQGIPAYALRDETDQRLKILFGLGLADFAAGRRFEAMPLRFKLPGNAAQDRTRAYAAYVEGMCAIVATAQPSHSAVLPQDWRDVRALLFPTGVANLEVAVRQCWSMGIGVLALRDSVAFHGACRRVDGRATIVLKRTSRHHSRWLFNLCHEIFHLVTEQGDFTLIEADETAAERRSSIDERRANRFAALVLTNGRLEAALAEIIAQSRGSIERLARAVERTAQAHAIPTGILANLVAENVQANSGRRWWGTAEKLQPEEDDPWKTVRDVFIEEADLASLGAIQLELLRNVLESVDD